MRAEPTPGANGPAAPLRRTIALAAPATGRLALTVLLGAGAIAADVGLIATAAWLISRAAQHPNESELAVAIVGVQFFGLSRGLLRYGERLVGHDTAFRLLADLRVAVYTRLERLAPAGLWWFRRGDLLARTVQDVDSLQDLVVRVVPPFAIAALVGTATVVLVWWMLPAAGVILGVTLLVASTVVPWLTGSLARRRESRFARARGELAAAMVDLTEGASELVAFGAMDAQLDAIRDRDAELGAIATASAGTAGVGLALTTLLAGLACWGALLVGAPAVVSGRLSGTELAVVALIPLAAFELVVGLPAATQALQRVRQAAARVFEVTDAVPPVGEPCRPATMPAGPHDLEAHSVWARYPGAGGPALRGVDLSLPAGRRVVVTGASGAGKSTLAAVLLGFLPCEGGSVSIDGVPLDRLSGADLRVEVGLVGQDAFLFDTTIAENLRIGRRDVTDLELREVLGCVGLARWLDELPLGLETPVGRHGAQLSGGQHHRVALARALLADFRVLILDEPAEHLDPVGAAALLADLLDATEDRSLVLISHHLTGLEAVDEVLVLDGGRVVERGPHHRLLAEGGPYASLLWDQQEAERFAPHQSEEAQPRQPCGETVAGTHGTPNDWSPVR